MSMDRARPSDNDTKSPKPAGEHSSAPEQVSVDQRLKHLKDEVLPFYPFLLTVPSDAPFRLGGHLVNNWAVGNGGPFSSEEHQLQYMTFLTHHEGDSLLVAVGDWSDDTGSVMMDQRPGLQGTTSTPSTGSVKKKISLNDYKNKSKGGTSASPINHDAVSQSAPMHQTSNDKKRASDVSPPPQSTNRPAPSTATSPKSMRQPASGHAGCKRSPGFEREHMESNDGNHSKQHSPKRPRLSPDQAANEKPSRSTNGLPALLSPTLPPTSNSPSLPQLLSPTLPPSVEKELASMQDSTHEEDRVAPDRLMDKARKLGSSSIDLPPPLDSARSPNFQDLQNRSSLNRATPASLLERYEHSKTNISSRINDSNQRGSSRQLVVKLKYGRSNKKRVEALLRFPGKRKAAAPGKKASNDSLTTPISNSSVTTPYRSEKKTRHAPSTEPNGVPREQLQERKNTAPGKVQTPVAQHGRSKQMAPAKDLQATSFRQTDSGSEGKTPFTQGTKVHTGDPRDKLSPSQSSAQADHWRNCERRTWKDEYLKYSNLGRELKHAADRHTAKNGVTVSDEKTKAATAVEAILCFILAFVTDDQSKVLARQIGDSTTWRSILAYWRVVRTITAPYPQLYSLCLILGAVSYDAIHALDLDRLAISPLPGEYTPVPSLTSDGSTISEEDSRRRKEFLELKYRLSEHYKESQRLWREGTKGLAEDVLDREFPETWQNRSKRYSDRGRPILKAGHYSGDYFLPIGKTDTPVEVVRFGWSFLNEWCKKEGLHWHGRLNL